MRWAGLAAARSLTIGWQRSFASALLALAVTATSAAAIDPTVILLAWDGVRHDYLDRERFPALARMQRDGARAERLVPVFPSLTFPNLVALATGTAADRHGIVANIFRDSNGRVFSFSNDPSWIEAEPVWVTAERQHVRAAAFFWVGSEEDWRGIGATYRRTPFDRGVPESEKVEQVVRWLDLPDDTRPRLILSWWHGADRPGHQNGPESDAVMHALREQDGSLAQLLRAIDARQLWQNLTLIVVSDHGMTAIDRRIDLGPVLAQAQIGAQVFQSDGVASVWLQQPAQRDAALAAIRGVAGVRAYPGTEVPEALRYRVPSRVGDIVALCDPPAFFDPRRGLEAWYVRLSMLFGGRYGAHGYDPGHPDMGGIFLALGRGVRPGTTLPPVRAIDVAPTVTTLLGIAPPAGADGKAIELPPPPAIR
jgi:predicted AlkP superfamily pyrophosphatase or phosphodiesterase